MWPVVIGYLEAARMLIAWCELRRGFRSFRIDRIQSATFLDKHYPERAPMLRARWLVSWRDAATRKSPSRPTYFQRTGPFGLSGSSWC